MVACAKMYSVMDKSSYAPKEMWSNKQRISGGEIRRRVHILRLKNGEFYGIIKYQILRDNHAFLHT